MTIDAMHDKAASAVWVDDGWGLRSVWCVSSRTSARVPAVVRSEKQCLHKHRHIHNQAATKGLQCIAAVFTVCRGRQCLLLTGPEFE